MVDITWYGQACFKIKGKNASLVVDPFEGQFTGLKTPKLDANIVCVTHEHKDHNNADQVGGIDGQAPFAIYGPGEYEISGINVCGVASFHDDKDGAERGKNTIYQITIDEIVIVHLGDLGQKKLSQVQIETLSGCDVLLIPVGGVYTIEAKDTPDIIASLEPKIIVPMHYKVEGLKFELAGVGEFLKQMGKENVEKTNKLSVSRDRLPEELEVAVLEITS